MSQSRLGDPLFHQRNFHLIMGGPSDRCYRTAIKVSHLVTNSDELHEVCDIFVRQSKVQNDFEFFTTLCTCWDPNLCGVCNHSSYSLRAHRPRYIGLQEF